MIPSAKEVLFSHPCACWLVCQQDYRKVTEWFSMKLAQRTNLNPKKTPFIIGVDLEKETDPGFFLSLSLKLYKIECFLLLLLMIFLIISQVVIHGS